MSLPRRSMSSRRAIFHVGLSFIRVTSELRGSLGIIDRNRRQPDRLERAVSIAVVAKEVISTSDAPGGFAGYSQAIRARGLVFVSGQGPFDPATGDVVGDTVEEQTRQCLRNVEAILKAAGSTIDDVVQATFILLDESDFAGMNEEWNRWFPTDPPARQGAKLPISPKGMRISIAAIAVS